ncbi:ABC transporter permease [Diplocloster modestus]|uniref:ABC transporter permease n=1 Tax=Diplocloster modestus TaxID=2850322 RepID=A0ABS6KEX6_9FIRM|nr:ABC transporter permease [Diplocloster modestus]MBU9729081.1 ABC transporter permease [Diplocloster modestus]
MKKIIKNNYRELSVIAAIAIMFIIFGILNPIYISSSNIVDILDQATIYGLMGIGMTMVIITGGIDLSVGSVLALSGCIVANMAVKGLNPVLCLIVGLFAGFAFGLLNGLLVSKMKLQPFIATMGTMSVYRGAAYIITEGYPVLGVPDSFRNILNIKIVGGIRISVLVFIAFAVLIYILLRKTRLGTYIYAIGGNMEAARLSGVRVELTQTMAYAIGMLGTALAGLIQVAKLGTGDPTTGNGWELNAIAAAAIGGTSMAGGRGNALGTVLGAILFSGLKVGLIVLNVNTYYQYVATGLVIIIAAYLEIFQGAIASRKKKKVV